MVMTGQKFQNLPLIEKQSVIQSELRNFLHETSPDTSGVSYEVALVLKFVHRNLFNPNLTVNLIKLRCGIRNNNISTRFRLDTGLTIREYIEYLRLGAAQRLLDSSQTEIYLIAPAVGYHHLETFYRAFKRSFGCTPLEYRNH